MRSPNSGKNRQLRVKASAVRLVTRSDANRSLRRRHVSNSRYTDYANASWWFPFRDKLDAHSAVRVLTGPDNCWVRRQRESLTGVAFSAQT